MPTCPVTVVKHSTKLISLITAYRLSITVLIRQKFTEVSEEFGVQNELTSL
jgi:hypothetical protein